MTRGRGPLVVITVLGGLALGGAAVLELGRAPGVLMLGGLSVAGVWWLGRFGAED